MSYYVWIEMDGFYASHFEADGRPLLVCRDKLVLDADPVARHKGVAPGMELRKAKALLANCVCKKWEREDHVAAQIEWLDICTDYTGVIEPVDQHAAALDLSDHPNPLDITERLVRQLASVTRLPVRNGAARSKWIAKLASDRSGDAVETPELFLSDLPVTDLLPVSIGNCQRLSFLGYRTIGEVAQIPLSILQRQFGDQGLTIHKAAKGKLFEPVEALYPLDSLRDCFLFKGAVDDSEVLHLGLKSLAGRVGKRLSERGIQSNKLEVRIETGETRVVERRRNFTKPILDPRTALAGLRLVFQEFESPDSPFSVSAIRITLSDLAKTKHQQPRLNGFESLRTTREARSAVGRVRTVFGDGSIKLAGEIEVPRRVLVLREWQNGTGWR